ncbi:MAG: hypothetical protein QOF46_2119, partial [Paraburkholderia sp.]|nr:hypothetical protein [Paraburkholderia sp.]
MVSPREDRPGIGIDAHGLIGNMRTTALVSTEGVIDFMCFPRIDSPTVFGSLLHPENGGAFSITPTFAVARTKQMYLPETNVLLTRFMSAQAVCEIVDFMPVSNDDDDAKATSNCVVRIVRAIYGDMSAQMRCAPRLDYARGSHETTQVDASTLRFTPADKAAGAQAEALTLDATVPLSIDHDDAVASFDLKQDETACFIFGAESEAMRKTLPCKEALSDTIDFWREWSGQSTYRGRYREVVMRSALLLKLLSSRATGAI